LNIQVAIFLQKSLLRKQDINRKLA